MSRRTKTKTTTLRFNGIEGLAPVEAVTISSASLTPYDNRRERDYSAHVSISWRLPDALQASLSGDVPFGLGLPEDDQRRVLCGPEAAARAAFRAALPHVLVGTGESTVNRYPLRVDYISGARFGKAESPAHVVIDFRVDASKPSEILTEDGLREIVDMNGKRWTDRLASMLEKCATARAELRQIAEARRVAARVAEQVAKRADERARKAVRFKQRLAALVAELEAEQAEQIKDVVAEEREGGEVWVNDQGERTSMTKTEAAAWRLALDTLTQGEGKPFLRSALPSTFGRDRSDSERAFDAQDVAKQLGMEV